MNPWNQNPSSHRPPPGPPPGSNPYPTPSFPPPPFGQPGYSYSGQPPNFPGPPPGPPPPGPPPGHHHGPPLIPSETYPSVPSSRYPGPPIGPPPGPPPRPPFGQQNYGPQLQGSQQPFFQYSQCTGRKKALCIGINYIGQQEALRGCINDARNIERFLCGRFGYNHNDIVVLTDDQQDPRSRPTRDSILRAMGWLVTDARPDDSLFFHYSGHGGQTKDLDGDEEDGYDEVIYPVDFKKAGHIVDDLIHDIMVKPLPPGCRLTAIFDSCHSGSALDLPFMYSTEGKIKEPNLVKEAGQGLFTAASSYARGDVSGVMQSVTGFVRAATTGRSARQISLQTKTSPADVISWSGCKDSQTSADAVEAGAATGAMSYAFITALTQQPRQSYQQLLITIRGILRAKYSQKPQLSSSHPMDTNLEFIA